MPEGYRWHGALATLGLEARALTAVDDAGIVLCERPHRTQLAIRGDASDEGFRAAIDDALGVALPVAPRTAHRDGRQTLLWLGPDEWLAVLAPGRGPSQVSDLREALSDSHHSVVDVSHSRVVLGLEGVHARELLMKGTNVDLHPREFSPDNCVQAQLARCHMLLHQLDTTPSYDIYVHRSFAVYAWSWIEDAAAEYRLTVRSTADA